MTNAEFLGNNSYPVIVSEIYEKIKNAECSTPDGNKICIDLYENMNDSITPLMTFRKFAKESKIVKDEKLQEVIDYCEERLFNGAGDLNFVINLVKEEHLDYLKNLNHPNPEETIQNLEDKFEASGEELKSLIKKGVFNSLQSKLYKKMLADLDIDMTNPEIDMLGEQSYPAILNDIYNLIQKSKCQTNVGEEVRLNIYKRLNESTTPIHEIKEFVTGAEKIAGDDVTICDIVKFCKNKIQNGDLNFIINLCKEEHFKNMTRLNHPSPESTVESIKDKFNKNGSVIEQGIKSGLFDGLQSKLLNRIKVDLDTESQQNLNESYNFESIINGNIITYSPIGIKLEASVKNNDGLTDKSKVVYLMESNIFEFDDKTKSFKNLNESEKQSIVIPNEHKLLMTSITSLPFDPEKYSFSLNESWDFNLELHSNGNATVNGKEIPKDKIKDLLLESVKVYESNKSLIPSFSRINYLKDADNFIALCENHPNLIKFDQIEVIKNLNENDGSSIIYDKSVIKSKPEILSSNVKGNVSHQRLFESFSELMNETNIIFGSKLESLFESQITIEQALVNQRNEKIVSLNESQSELNISLKKIKDLKGIAEVGSPALIKLNEQEEKVNKKLGENLAELNQYKNNFNLYN